MGASFSKNERLCKKKDFDLLFISGNSLYQSFLKAQIFFFVSNNPEVKVAFVIPAKKIKRAVDRNYLKRIMREVYRKNKHILIDSLQGKSIHIAFVYLTNELVKYKQMEQVLLLLLRQIQLKYISNLEHN